MGILDRCAHPGLLADLLLAEFGSLGAIVAAKGDRIWRTVEDDTAVSAIQRFQDAMRQALFDAVTDGPIIENMPALEAYLLGSLAHRTAEQMRVLYLDSKNRLIADEIGSLGTLDRTALYPREILHRALDLGAGALILAHNHPSGDPSPSRSDIDLTKRLAAAAAPLAICLHDHVIVGHGRCFSLRAHGYF